MGNALRAFWAEVGGGVNGGGVIGPKRKSMAWLCLARARALSATPAGALESQITVFLVFLIIRSLPKRFDRAFNPLVLTRYSRFW